MAFSSAHWAIDYGAKTVTNNDSGTGTNLPAAFGDNTYVGATLAFFQWLATTFAASAQMDDTYPMQSDTPTVFKWTNGWTFGHADDYKYLEGGSVEDPSGSGTATADSLWANLYSIGSQTTGTQIALFQNDAEETPWWISGNLDILVLVKDTGAWVQSDDTAGTPTNGGVWVYAREFGDLYDHNFADISGGGRNPVGVNTSADAGNTSGELYVTVSGSSGTWTVGSFLSDDVTGATGKIASVVGSDIYLNAVRGGTLTPTNACTEYTDRELQTAGDASATISSVTNVVAGYTNIHIAFVQYKATGGTTSGGAFVFGETITQAVSGATGKFIAEVSDVLYFEVLTGSFNATGQITGAVGIYTPTGTSAQTSVTQDLNNGAGVQPYNVFVGDTTRAMTEQYEWYKYATRYGSTGATYTLNADDGQEYRSCIEGTYAEVKVAPFGTLAGTTFYGARGVWVEEYTTADFVLIDADGDTQAPPDYQKVTANHASLSGCRIFVAERSGTALVKNQYTVSTATATTIVATGAIDINKTPQTGSVRMDDDVVYTYTGYNSATFTGVSPDPTGETGDFYCPLLDILADAVTESSDNVIYGAPFDVRTTVRKYGFKPYDVDTAFGATGLTFSPILTTDPQAT